jgi:hypothetical protein
MYLGRISKMYSKSSALPEALFNFGPLRFPLLIIRELEAPASFITVDHVHTSFAHASAL